MKDISEVMRAIDIEARRSRDKDGVHWTQAPLPRRVHRCKPQTWEYDYERKRYWLHCACGGVTLEGWVGAFTKHPWINKNTRPRPTSHA